MRVLYIKFTFVFLFIFSACGIFAQGDGYATRFEATDGLKMRYNTKADGFINDYIANPYTTGEALGRYLFYKDYIDSVMTAYRVPVEAGLLVMAQSNADCFYGDVDGNSGPWALQYKVARMYALKMNTYVDERRDIKQATELAAKHLKELKLLYDDWPLALAAFATTTLTVNKFIRMSGNTFNYWAIRDSLPPQAQKIVPAYIAASYIYHHHAQHGISPKEYKLPASDTMVMNRWMSFAAMAPTLHTSVGVLQTLNPIFKKGIVPLAATPYVLNIPTTSRPWYDDLDTVTFIPYNMNPYVEEESPGLEENLPRPKDAQPAFTGGDTIIHVVLKGQGLGVIAKKYNVKVDEIRKWNKLKGFAIHPGQKLIILRKKE